MKQNDLRPPDGAKKNRKRVGRGYGSGHGKTAGRGQKGQNARSGGGVRLGFEGGQNPLIQRMPYKRGFNNPLKKVYQILNIADVERVGLGGELTPETLLAAGLVDRSQASTREFRVKLLGDGEVSRAYNVRLHRVSAGARQKIEAVGGTVEEMEVVATDDAADSEEAAGTEVVARGEAE